jgi:hypothetical protein
MSRKLLTFTKSTIMNIKIYILTKPNMINIINKIKLAFTSKKKLLNNIEYLENYLENDCCKVTITDCTIYAYNSELFTYFVNFLFDYNIDTDKKSPVICNDHLKYKQIIDNLLPIKEKLLNDNQYLECKQYFIDKKIITIEIYNAFIKILHYPNENNVIGFLKEITISEEKIIYSQINNNIKTCSVLLKEIIEFDNTQKEQISDLLHKIEAKNNNNDKPKSIVAEVMVLLRELDSLINPEPTHYKKNDNIMPKIPQPRGFKDYNVN